MKRDTTASTSELKIHFLEHAFVTCGALDKTKRLLRFAAKCDEGEQSDINKQARHDMI